MIIQLLPSSRKCLLRENGLTTRSIFLLQMTPRCFLIGHSGPILSLAFVHLTTDNFDLIVSSSDNGYVIFCATSC